MSTGAATASKSLRVALIAGEDSGDMLGAALARALQDRHPTLELVGMGGPRMAAAGVICWHDISELSVMGLAEVARHLPRLLRLRRRLARRLLTAQVDVVVGIDAPDFNLGLEKRIKRAGVKTVHYVSPSVWAWRAGRAARIGACADRVLCLFPMEPPIYARHGVDARFVGHPLATRFPVQPDRTAARTRLGLAPDRPVLALLPGSRGAEIARLGADFLDAARRVAVRVPGIQIVLPAANPRCFKALRELLAAEPALAAQSDAPDIHLIEGRADQALLAADVALLASGTVALEAMLAKCPMVVGYKIAPLTYTLIRRLKLMQTSLYSLPNILAGRALVTELMQTECRPDTLTTAMMALFSNPERCQALREAFVHQHQRLLGENPSMTPAMQAAMAVLDLTGATHVRD